jgi:hypothetical protein
MQFIFSLAPGCSRGSRKFEGEVRKDLRSDSQIEVSQPGVEIAVPEELLFSVGSRSQPARMTHVVFVCRVPFSKNPCNTMENEVFRAWPCELTFLVIVVPPHALLVIV